MRINPRTLIFTFSYDPPLPVLHLDTFDKVRDELWKGRLAPRVCVFDDRDFTDPQFDGTPTEAIAWWDGQAQTHRETTTIYDGELAL